MGHAKRLAKQTGGGGAAPYSMEALEPRTLLSLVSIHDVEVSSELVPYDDHLYFIANGAGPESALYRTDGTPQGLEVVKSSGVQTLNPYAPLVIAGNLLFFNTYDSVTEQTSIWRTDGTAGGTFALLSTEGIAVPKIISAGGVTYIVPHWERREQAPLWKSDGTVAGTSVVASDFLEGSRIDSIVSYNGKAFFTAFMPIPNQSRYAPVLVGTDGTDGGTNVIYTFKYDAYVSRFETSDVTSNLLVAGDTMYFDYPVRQGVWTSRGTSQTTLPLQLTVGGRLRRYARTPLSMEQVGDRVLIQDISYGWHLANTTTSVEVTGSNFRVWDNHFYLTRNPSYGVAEIVRYDSQSWTPVTQVILSDGGSPPTANFVARLGQTTYFGAGGTAVEDEYNYSISGVHPLRAAQGTPQNIVEVDVIGPENPVLFKNALYFATQKHIYRLEASKGTVSGWVYRDQEGETAISWPFIEGATVYADLNKNGVYDSGEPSDITSSTGAYRFEVAPGTYDIRVAGPSPTWNSRTRPVTVPTSVGANQLKMVHFGIDDFAPTARIAGRVHRDLNKNGQFETGEGFAKVQVYLDLNNNGKWETTEPWRIPDANGNYEFTGLVGGYYSVRHIHLREWDLGEYATDNLGRVMAEAGTTVTRNFNVLRKQKVSGVIFNDQNGDGIRQTNEPPLANQSLAITVLAPKQGNFGIYDVPVANWTVRTDANGTYQANIHVQKYYVNALAPVNWRVSTGANIARQALEGGSTTVDMGLTQRALIQGVVSLDQSSWLDHTVAVVGWRVFVDLNLDGKWNNSEPSATTTFPDPYDGQYGIGKYALPPLPRGTYSVGLIPKSSYIVTSPLFNRVFVGHGGTAYATFQAIPTWTVRGMAFNDANWNQLLDVGEAGVAGARVFMDQNKDGLLTAGEPVTTSASSGAYSLNGVHGYNADIVWLPPTGWRESTFYTLTPDTTGTATFDFGITNTAVIEGFIINDQNGNGKQDSSESMTDYAGWTVWADIDRDGIQDANEPYDEDWFGVYQLYLVPPGKQTLRLRVDSGMTPTSPSSKTLTISPGTRMEKVNFLVRDRRDLPP